MMGTKHTIVFGDCCDMRELQDESIHLAVFSPPYFQPEWHYKDLYGGDYTKYLQMLKNVSRELYRVIKAGRAVCIVTSDVIVAGKRYPVVADTIKTFQESGFDYSERNVWKKPEGFIRISRRSGVMLQHPLPTYYFPDYLYEDILIFKKGRLDRGFIKELPKEILEKSKIDIREFQSNKWNLSVWNIMNVPPIKGRLEAGISAFPDEIPYRLIKLYSFVGETVLDPFVGSGTTIKVAKELGRNSVAYELDIELKPTILEKIGYNEAIKDGDKVEIIERPDAQRLKTQLQNRIKRLKSSTRR